MDKLLFLKKRLLPPISDFARPEERLADNTDVRIDGKCNMHSRMPFFTGNGMHDLGSDGKLGPEKVVHGFPEGARIYFVSWSNDGTHLAFTIRVDQEDDNISELRVWIADVETGKAKPLFQSENVNAVFANYVWVNNSTLLLCTITASRGCPPKKSLVPPLPKIESNEQKNIVQSRIYQDLNKQKYDEDLLEYYATSQLVLTSLDGKVERFGQPAPYTSIEPSPDQKYVLISSIHKPYSFTVPRGRFPMKVELWKTNGKTVRELCDRPLAYLPIASKNLKIVRWRADKPSTLYWIERHDAGDIKVNVSPCVIYTQPADSPEGEQPKILHKLDLPEWRIYWCDDSLALLYESCPRTPRVKIWVLSPGSDNVNSRILFDVLSEDNIGFPILWRHPTGTYVIARLKKENDEGTYVLLYGSGAKPQGNLPFLDLVDINTGNKERIWESDKEKYYETVVGLMSDHTKGYININQLKILTTKESKSDNLQYFIQSWPEKKAYQITDFPHPHPQLAPLHEEMVQYNRDDGVPLTATLYLPPGYDPSKDGCLPCLVWPNQREFDNKGCPNIFSRIHPLSGLVWLTRRFAVLSVPIIPIGEGVELETHDGYMDNLVAGVEAAVEEVIRLGVADKKQIAVGGHSYGAFATANLLTDPRSYFSCGIACSGAYNTTLSPFGFQNEKRTLWDAPDDYNVISPLMQAKSITKPILLIHGEADDHPVTFPAQSVCFFNALQHLGVVSRLVLLPYERHGILARESVMQVLWETDRWLQKYCVGPK